MIDIRTTITPKSDQMNADDLIGGPRTIRVTRVSLLAAADQPIAINFEGDDGKPYKPCKSMRRVLVSLWGPDGAAYAGRSMTLYRDDSVAFGGLQVGGIRISHMSHIDGPKKLALTATRGSRKPFIVQPLANANDPAGVSLDIAALSEEAESAVKRGTDAYATFWKRIGRDGQRALLPDHEDRKRRAAEADCPPTDFDPKTGEVFEGQADQGAQQGEQAPAEVIDWTAKLAELKAGANACKTVAELVDLKKANKAAIDAMPDDVHADWTDFVDDLAGALRGAK